MCASYTYVSNMHVYHFIHLYSERGPGIDDVTDWVMDFQSYQKVTSSPSQICNLGATHIPCLSPSTRPIGRKAL